MFFGFWFKDKQDPNVVGDRGEPKKTEAVTTSSTRYQQVTHLLRASASSGAKLPGASQCCRKDSLSYGNVSTAAYSSPSGCLRNGPCVRTAEQFIQIPSLLVVLGPFQRRISPELHRVPGMDYHPILQRRKWKHFTQQP